MGVGPAPLVRESIVRKLDDLDFKKGSSEIRPPGLCSEMRC
jgi:hypothetical protein